jgi:hypothetical protein
MPASGTGWPLIAPRSTRRRTCVVSKAKRMVDASIALFVRFGDAAGIGELLSMLA